MKYIFLITYIINFNHSSLFYFHERHCLRQQFFNALALVYFGRLRHVMAHEIPRIRGNFVPKAKLIDRYKAGRG